MPLRISIGQGRVQTTEPVDYQPDAYSRNIFQKLSNYHLPEQYYIGAIILIQSV